MADRSFPETALPLILRRTAVEIVIPRQPLANIFQTLGISIHDVVNGAEHRCHVRGLYKIARRMDDESWLRRRFEQHSYEAWIDAHL